MLVEKLLVVLEVSLAFSREQDGNQLLTLIVEKAVEITAAERGCIVLVDEEGQSHLTSTYNLPAEEGRNISSSVVQTVLREGRAVALDNLPEKGVGQAESIRLQGLRAIMCAPLRLHGIDLGVLYVDARWTGGFTSEDLTVFEALAAQAAASIENSRLRERLIRDDLTGAFSRGYFEWRLEEEVARARESSQPMALLIADLDSLKQINEEWGHAEGDDAIRTLAEILRTRADDLSFRIGGDEFVVILLKTNRSGAEAVRARVEAASQEILEQVQGKRGWFGVGVGIAVYPEDGSTPRALYIAADDDLTKQRGRKRRRDPLWGASVNTSLLSNLPNPAPDDLGDSR